MTFLCGTVDFGFKKRVTDYHNDNGLFVLVAFTSYCELLKRMSTVKSL